MRLIIFYITGFLQVIRIDFTSIVSTCTCGKTILKSATNADSDCSGKVYLCFDNQFSIGGCPKSISPLEAA